MTFEALFELSKTHFFCKNTAKHIKDYGILLFIIIKLENFKNKISEMSVEYLFYISRSKNGNSI